MRGGWQNLRFSANIGIHALDMALGVIQCRVVNLDFVFTRFSHMHRCRAFPFALAELFLYCVVAPLTLSPVDAS